MTVKSEVFKASYAGDDVTTVFAVPFRFLDNSHILATLRAADGTETVLVLDTDYTVTGAGAENGGELTRVTALATGESFVVSRSVPLLQETEYEANDKFPAAQHEEAIDELTMIAQQHQEELDRTIRSSITSSNGDVTIPEMAGNGGRVLAINDEGTNLAVGPTTTDIENAEANATTATTQAAAAGVSATAASDARDLAEQYRDEAQAAAASLNDPLPRDGSEAMTGSLNMDGNGITNVSSFAGAAVATQAEVSNATAGDKLMSYTRTAEAIAALAQGGGYLGTYIFETSQDFIKANYPAFTRARITAVGGGGGGAGADTYATSHEVAATGGSAGGTAIKDVLFDDLADTEAMTIGAAGAGGAATGANGGNGGQTTFGAHAQADGGFGGFGTGLNANFYIKMPAQRGGYATVGDILIGGGAATPADSGGYGGSRSVGGTGGSSTHGGGGVGGWANGAANTFAPTPGLGYGAGGGGGADITTAGQAGAAGSQGVVIVELFA